MSNVTPYRPQSPVGEAALYDQKMLALIRRTVAKDANEDEFNVFISMARSLRLDPLRKQIYCFIYHKDKPDKRQMTVVTSIAGFRTIADRTGNYRPDEDEPSLHFDEGEKSAVNPLGLVKAVVRVHKFIHGAWHRVTAEAYWAEYAPIKDEWAADERGTRRPTGKQTLDVSGQWGKMPRVMLAKVAEAAALRKAFPDELANIYADEEVDRQKFLDLTPAEAVEAGETQARLERIGGAGSLVVDWLKGDLAPLDMVPSGQFADRAMAFIGDHAGEASQLQIWATKNRETLRQFWAASPGDALEVKKALEKALADREVGQ